MENQEFESQQSASTSPDTFNGSVIQRMRLRKMMRTIKACERKGQNECAVDFKMNKEDARNIANHLTSLGYEVRLKIWYSPPNTVTFKVYWR